MPVRSHLVGNPFATLGCNNYSKKFPLNEAPLQLSMRTKQPTGILLRINTFTVDIEMVIFFFWGE